MTDPHTPPAPNLALIQQVQRARMLHDAQAVPSALDVGYWVECKPAVDGGYPTPRAGGWIILTTRSQSDAHWALIKAATQAGRLGYKSKISTSPAPGQANAEVRMIVVRTRDADDPADVERVRAALVELELHPVRYERD
jgi:hypothetical protein